MLNKASSFNYKIKNICNIPTNSFNSFNKIVKRNIVEILSPEEYMFNRKNTKYNTSLQKSTLDPLRGIHEPNITHIKLVGTPYNKISYNLDPPLTTDLAINNPDIIFLQIDPMPYMTRQRYMSHKAALHGVEDYNVKAVDNLNTPSPISWEECVVDLLVLDMSYANQIHTKLDYTKGFYTYAYPNLQLVSTHDNLTNKMIAAITDYVIADKWSPYHEISNILFESLMGKHRVILGDMPEILLRQILGNTLTISETRDIFKMVLSKIEDLGRNNVFRIDGVDLLHDENEKSLIMKRITLDLFSHIFQAPRDLYMTALLKNVGKAAFSTLAYVGNPHFIPIQKYWLPPPKGINYTQATQIPDRIDNETNEDLIEKQVIFDILLSSRVWAEKYVFNPFPYINEDITKIENLDNLKKTFFINTKKYEMFRDKIIEGFSQRRIEFDSKHPDKVIYTDIKKISNL